MSDKENICTYEVDDDGIAIMTINYPPMNVLCAPVATAITHCMLQAKADTRVRVIVLTGKGKAFVAGADISEFKEVDTLEKTQIFCDRVRTMNSTITSFDKPVIGAINGFCLGGGLEVALSCHMRIASEAARFGTPEITLGIIPGFGGTQRLYRVVGKAKAIEMVLTGAHITAQEALAYKLVNKVVPADELMKAATDMARVIAKKGRLAVTAGLKSICISEEVGLEEGLDLETREFKRVKVSADGVEGADAFLSKREAIFRDM